MTDSFTKLHMNKKWFQPGIIKFRFGGFARQIELDFKVDYLLKLKDPEESYAFMQEMRERYELDKYLVYKKCPECGWELPTMDFDIGGWCAFCGSKKAKKAWEEKNNARNSLPTVSK